MGANEPQVAIYFKEQYPGKEFVYTQESDEVTCIASKSCVHIGTNERTGTEAFERVANA
jgi:hypothetical protein